MREDDPYWDAFISAPPVDPNNVIAGGIRGLPEGTVYPIKTDVHSPEIMSRHVKELALFLGADRCGIAALGPSPPAPLPRLGEGKEAEEYPFAIVCVLKADYDPRSAQGIGGQAPALKGAYVTFNLGAWIRECGYRATREGDLDAAGLAQRAGLGWVDGRGRFEVPGVGPYAYVTNVLRTDLPLAADGKAVP